MREDLYENVELILYLVIEIREGLRIFKQRNYMIRLTIGKVNSPHLREIGGK